MCDECETNRQNGHNYCRKCGYHLTKGFVQNVRVATVYYAHEKYCGYCGKKQDDCKCH